MNKVLKRFSDVYMNSLKLIFPDMDEKKLRKIVKKEIENSVSPLEGRLHNNYDNTEVPMNTLEAIEFIDENKAIMSGRGVLYKQHSIAENPSDKILEDIFLTRKKEKKLMLECTSQGNMEEAKFHDNRQKNSKIFMNSWFGVTLQKSSYFFNPYCGLSIMGKGRSIIAHTAIAFERFLSNTIKFDSVDQMMTYINNIVSEEYNTESVIDEEYNISKKRLYKYLTSRFSEGFNIDIYSDIIKKICDNLNQNDINKIYYKNNLFKFLRNSKAKKIINRICKSNAVLSTAEIAIPKDAENPEEFESLFKDINKLWGLCEKFVFYNYGTFDRLNKIRRMKRNSVIVVDTDSNFINLNPWLNYLYKQKFIEDRKDEITKFRLVNTMAIMITNIANSVCAKYCDNSNIPEERKSLINMKNEFYYSRIVLCRNKKTYAGLVKIKEGKILNPPKLDIKGFMFKKSNFNKEIAEMMNEILENDILKIKKIDVLNVIHKTKQMENFIRESLIKGEKRFWKPSNANTPESYKAPMTQGQIRAIYTYNMLYPEKAMSFPSQISMVKLKSNISEQLESMKKKYPNEYNIINHEILENKLWSNYGMSVFCVPRNEKEIPEWLIPMIDVETIVMDSLTPFLLILNSVGIKTINTLANKEFNSQIIYFK